MRHRVAREAHQRVDDLLGVVAGGARVPQAQWRQSVGVHVLGAALEFGERGDRGACLGGLRMVDLEQQGLVRLHDQRSVGHAGVLFVERLSIVANTADTSDVPPAA